MKIHLTCPHCSANFDADHRPGMAEIHCPECSERVELPDDAAAASGVAPLALVMALVAGGVGSVVWALVALYANLEIGYLAWGIGGLVGFAAVKFGGRGVVMGGIAAVISVLSIFGGKFAAIEGEIRQMTDRTAHEAYVEEMQVDVEALEALGPDPSDERLAIMMSARGYTDEDPGSVSEEAIENFRESIMPTLVEFDAQGADYDKWSENQDEWIRMVYLGEDGHFGAIKSEMNLIDAIFLLLGLSTAFGLVSKA